ncbi:MAG: hypothetical protein ACFFDT_07780 [Candidatus Hodarchaeota archaeon]
MPLDNMVDKIRGNTDKIGALLGLLSAPNTSEPYGGTSGLDRLMESLDNATKGELHAPDLSKVAYEFRTNANNKTMILAYLGAEVGKYFGLPIIGKWMVPLQKFAISFIGGQLAQSVVVRSTHSPGNSAYNSISALTNSGYEY